MTDIGRVEDDLIWGVRAFVYERFAETAAAPAIADIAARFELRTDEAELALQELHHRHAIYLE